MLVQNILDAKGGSILTVPSDARVADAVAVLNQHRIGAVVVVAADGTVAGILSERDVVRRLADDPTRLLASPVTACMTERVFTCERSTSVAALMEQMTQRRVRHIPVLENGRLVGIVSIGDIVKGKIEEAEREAAELRDYIAAT